MDIRSEIAARIDRLSPDMQERVLRFVSSLGAHEPQGESGVVLTRFAGFLDGSSAREMIQAIEEGCEQVDAREW